MAGYRMRARPVVLDCDPGIDDALALLLACACPEVTLLAVTAGYGNVSAGQAASNALRVLTLAGRADVPVAAGADAPASGPRPARTASRHGPDGVGGVPLPPPLRRLDPRAADDVLSAALLAAEVPVTLVATGPLTTVARLADRHPDAVAKLDRVVVLGGTVHPDDFNGSADPAATRRVLGGAGPPESPPVLRVPLDVARRVALSAEDLDRLRAGGHRVGATAAAMLEAYRAAHGTGPGAAVPVPDAVAVAAAVRPELLHVTVDTAASRRGNALVATDVEAPEVVQLLVGRLAAYRQS